MSPAGPASPPGPERSPWPTILLVAGAGVLSACQVGKAPAALEAVRADLGLDLAAASWLLAAFALVGAAAGFPIGLLVDRVGARRSAVAGLLLQALAGAAGAAAAGAPALLATRAVEGVGFLAVTVAAPSLIAAMARPRDLGRAMAVWGTFMPVGMTLALLLAAPLLAATGGWRGFWLANSGALAGCAGLLALGLPTPPVGDAVQGRRFAQDARDTLSSPAPWLLAVLFAAFASAFFAVFGFLPQLLAQRLGVGPSSAGVLSGLAVGASAVGNLACGALLARGARHAPILLGAFAAMALCAPGVLGRAAAPGWGHATVAYALCLLLSLASGLIPVALLDAAGRRAPRPDLVGATVGLMMQGNNLGLVLGPAAAAAIAARAGWPAVALLVAALAAAAVPLVVALRGVPRPRTAPPEPGLGGTSHGRA